MRSAALAESPDTTRGDEMIAAYFRNETRKLADTCLADVKSWEDWTSRREMYRQQLREMLGLDPLPERTPLNAVVTGKLDHDDFTVEKLHFQSRPGLYVTGNLYLPKNLAGKAPAILYVCGHSPIKKDGISYGNKVGYQHHGAWFAQNGYVCLVIDTLQLGEIEGVHHGTYREKMWWWNARGYTPAGVEAWNSIRAIDYLESRPEVDTSRIGITGRSGGGAYSWFTAALDDRIKAAVPVAGITNLEDHVVHGCVEGHCDCMYFVNTYRWDYPQLAALLSPRPLLIANTDRDSIFPLEGVLDVHRKTRRLYELNDKPQDLGLQIAAGGHNDLQVLQLHALQWFNAHWRDENSPIETVAKKYFEPEQLKVFDSLPTDATNARIHETFVPLAEASAVPETRARWQSQRNGWLTALRQKCFAGWPSEADTEPLNVRQVYDQRIGERRYFTFDFDSQHDVTLRLYLVLSAGDSLSELQLIELQPLDSAGWTNFIAELPDALPDKMNAKAAPSGTTDDKIPFYESVLLFDNCGLAFVAPRGLGPTAWNADPAAQTHIRRRFMLLGQTLDGMRVWDVRRAVQALRSLNGLPEVQMRISGEREMAGIALYAALFEPGIDDLDLSDPSTSHRNGPDFLNVLRFLDIPQTVAMVAENSQVRIHRDADADWEFPRAVAKRLGWGERVVVETKTAAP
jgi:cephalosporin-C deacetylase-like acetyl esterase